MKNLILPILFFIISFFVLKDYFNNKRNDLENNPKYTICRIKSTFYMRGAHFLTYYYFVNNKKQDGQFIVKGRCGAMIGKYYIVKYQKNKPSNSKVLCDKYITNSQISIPKNGWDTIPDTLRLKEVPEECRCNW
ncbi:MAG: hypothetical protein R6U95_05530 [Bacteroidales bacterium]